MLEMQAKGFAILIVHMAYLILNGSIVKQMKKS